jgi:hypothetical protein
MIVLEPEYFGIAATARGRRRTAKGSIAEAGRYPPSPGDLRDQRLIPASAASRERRNQPFRLLSRRAHRSGSRKTAATLRLGTKNSSKYSMLRTSIEISPGAGSSGSRQPRRQPARRDIPGWFSPPLGMLAQDHGGKWLFAWVFGSGLEVVSGVSGHELWPACGLLLTGMENTSRLRFSRDGRSCFCAIVCRVRSGLGPRLVYQRQLAEDHWRAF